MIVSRQSADNRKWMAIDFCPEAEFLILIRGQFSISCVRQMRWGKLLVATLFKLGHARPQRKSCQFCQKSNEVSLLHSDEAPGYLLNPKSCFNQVKPGSLMREREGGARLASVVLYFPPSFLNFGNSLAAPVNFDVARAEIIMIKYSSLLLGQSENNYLHRCLL